MNILAKFAAADAGSGHKTPSLASSVQVFLSIQAFVLALGVVLFILLYLQVPSFIQLDDVITQETCSISHLPKATPESTKLPTVDARSLTATQQTDWLDSNLAGFLDADSLDLYVYRADSSAIADSHQDVNGYSRSQASYASASYKALDDSDREVGWQAPNLPLLSTLLPNIAVSHTSWPTHDQPAPAFQPAGAAASRQLHQFLTPFRVSPLSHAQSGRKLQSMAAISFSFVLPMMGPYFAILVMATPVTWALAGGALRLLVWAPSHVCMFSMVGIAVVYISHAVTIAQASPYTAEDTLDFVSMLPAIILLALYFAYDQRAGFSCAAGRILSFGADVAIYLPAIRRLAVVSLVRALGVFVLYGGLFSAVALPPKIFANPAAATRVAGGVMHCLDPDGASVPCCVEALVNVKVAYVCKYILAFAAVWAVATVSARYLRVVGRVAEVYTDLSNNLKATVDGRSAVAQACEKVNNLAVESEAGFAVAVLATAVAHLSLRVATAPIGLVALQLPVTVALLTMLGCGVLVGGLECAGGGGGTNGSTNGGSSSKAGGGNGGVVRDTWERGVGTVVRMLRRAPGTVIATLAAAVSGVTCIVVLTRIGAWAAMSVLLQHIPGQYTLQSFLLLVPVVFIIFDVLALMVAVLPLGVAKYLMAGLECWGAGGGGRAWGVEETAGNGSKA